MLFAKASIDRNGSIFLQRLGMSTCEQTLNACSCHLWLKTDELFDRITRRKVIEAWGEEKIKPCTLMVLTCMDTEAVINAILALIRIGWVPDQIGTCCSFVMVNYAMPCCNSRLHKAWYKE